MTATWTTPRTWSSGEIITAPMLNQYLRDELDWLKGRPYSTEQDFDGTVFSTTSSSFQDTGISSGSLTTTGGRVLVICYGTTSGVAAGNGIVSTLYEDGVNKGDATYGMVKQDTYSSAVDVHVPFCIAYITPAAPTAAAHEWKLYIKNDDNTNTIYVRTAFIAAFEIGI